MKEQHILKIIHVGKYSKIKAIQSLVVLVLTFLAEQNEGPNSQRSHHFNGFIITQWKPHQRVAIHVITRLSIRRNGVTNTYHPTAKEITSRASKANLTYLKWVIKGAIIYNFVT